MSKLNIALSIAGAVLGAVVTWQITHPVATAKRSDGETVSLDDGPTAIDDEILKLFGGPTGVSIVAHPDKVRAFRLDVPRGEEPLASDAPGQSSPVELKASTAAELSKTLLSAGTYSVRASACEPDYGVRLEFTKGDHAIVVLLCFECDVMLVGQNGEPLGSRDFEPGRPALVRAVKECFPSDEAIQKIQVGRPR